MLRRFAIKFIQYMATNIHDFLSSDNASELQNVLRMPEYRLYIRSLKTGDGAFCFRVHNQQNRIAGRSRVFESRHDRDSLLNAFITFVEVEIHGRLQMELF